jgi:hypothetical protein
MMYTIDFFELMFLAEACIPPVPIARTVFWHNLTDVYRKQMSVEDRGRLRDAMRKHTRYDMANAEVREFDMAFDPSNQFKVTTTLGDTNDCYLGTGDRYYVSRNRWVSPEFIAKVEKLK